MKEFPIRPRFVKPMAMRNGKQKVLSMNEDEAKVQRIFAMDGYYKIILNGNFQLWHVHSLYGKFPTSAGKRKMKFVAQGTKNYKDLHENAIQVHLNDIPSKFRNRHYETLIQLPEAGVDVTTYDSSDADESVTSALSAALAEGTCVTEIGDVGELGRLERVSEYEKVNKKTGNALDVMEEAQEAREQEAREQAAREQEAREQAAREQAAQEQAAREQAAQEQAAREQAAREQVAWEQAAREQAAQEQEAREQADQEAREQADREAREQADREAREQADREATEQADQEATEQADREAREQADQEAREQADREAREKVDQEAREQADREAREKVDREAREQEAQEAREQADREAREKADREAREQADREAREQADQEAREQADREAREQADREAQDEHHGTAVVDVPENDGSDMCKFGEVRESDGNDFSNEILRIAELESELHEVKEKINTCSTEQYGLLKHITDQQIQIESLMPNERHEHNASSDVADVAINIQHVFQEAEAEQCEMQKVVYEQLNSIARRIEKLRCNVLSLKLWPEPKNYLLLYVLQNSPDACECVARLHISPCVDVL